MYQVIKETRSKSILFPIELGKWWRIVGPYGMEPQAYLNKLDAENVCEKLNQQPYFDAKDFCEEVRKRNENN